MNDAEARVPNVEYGWDAIDIFLFSNGQQFTPPRKYHLRANDLDWWEATLNHLAKLHFGSLQSVIELYTINGNKVEGPLELTDGAPYVAVVPPDTFMDTGYEKYLLRASRSWEKRKAKKANIEGDIKFTAESDSEGIPILSWSTAEPEIYRGEPSNQWPLHATENDSTEAELTTIKTPDDMNLAAASVLVKPQKIGPEKNNNMVNNPPPRRSIISTPISNNKHGKKHMNRPHTSFMTNARGTATPWQNNTKNRDQRKILTKIPIKIEGHMPVIPMKPKYLTTYPHESAVKPPLKTPPTTSPRKSSTPTTTLSSPKKSLAPTSLPPRTSLTPTTSLPPKTSVPPTSSLPPTTSPPPGTISPLTVIPVTTTPPVTRTQSLFPSTLLSLPTNPTNSDNRSTMLNIQAKDLVADKGLITDAASIQNVIGDKLFVIATNKNLDNQIENEIIISDDGIKHNTTSVEEEIQTQIEISTCEVNTVLSKRLSYSNSIKVIPAAVVSQSNLISCDIPLGDNCIAVINKGDAVHLNLNIELPNEKTSHPNNHSNVSFMSPNLRKVSSLTNVLKMKNSSIYKEDSEIPTKSLDSLVYNINECYANVVVVQCACCGNNTTIPRIDKMPVFKDNNGFFILMPCPGQEENSNCVCCTTQQTRCPDKKTISALCLELCKANSSSEFPCVPQKIGIATALSGSMESQTDKALSTICNMCVMDHRPLYKVCKDKCYNSSTSDSPILEKIEIFVSEDSTPKVLPVANCKPLSCNRLDRYTQTDWCGVLLQAKRHKDGRYSFHLPPLNVLKCYALI